MTRTTPSTTNRGRMRRPSLRIGIVVAAALVLASGCTTAPKAGKGTLAQAQDRVLGEVDAATALVGASTGARPLTTPGTLACNEKLLGYTVGHLREQRAEVRRSVAVTARDGAVLLPRVEQGWKAKGYTVDRSGLSDHRYPKIRTHIGADLVVVTGYVGFAQVNIYAVSPCVTA